MKMRFLPDEPISNKLEDILGFYDFVGLIQTSIYHTQSPFAFGVLGDWGSGKTSVLRLLEDRFNSDFQNGSQTFVPIWFNAWQYENEANIVYPLLYAIKRDYGQRVGAFDEVKEFGTKFLHMVTTSALALTDLGLRLATKYLAGETLKLADIETKLNAVKEHPGKLESVFNEWADQVAELHDAFEVLLATYATELAALHSEITKDEIRFVILIDDLDRCLPTTAITVLESIKNFLSVKNCVFVLGLNPKVIYQGIRIKYRGLEIDGREYLEKILNYTFYVPEPEPGKIAEFGKKQLEKLLLLEEDQKRYSGFFLQFGEILSECRFSNPRKIKRILNRYLFFLGAYDSTALAKFINRNIIRLLIIAEFFPDLFQLLLEDANSVAAALSRLVGDFDMQHFEARFGISISSIAPQLRRMHKLFKLDSEEASKKNLDEHVQAVFAITRLI